MTKQALPRFKARSLLKFTPNELFEMLCGTFILVFDDGELEVDWRSTWYSSYGWRFHQLYPETPLLVEHHLVSVLKGKYLNKSTHTDLLGAIMWTVYDHHLDAQGQPYLNRDELARQVYSINSWMYNDFSTKLEEYVTSMDILHFIAVNDHPDVKAAKEVMEATPESIEHVYSVMAKVLNSTVELPGNSLADAVKSKTVNSNQINQCLGPRGYAVDMDKNLFRAPIMQGFVGGMRLFTDSMKESRSCSLALNTAKAEIRDAEYFSRRQQLMCETVRRLHYGDCGSKEHLLWKVRGPRVEADGSISRQSDLKTLVGKYYEVEPGKYRAVKKNDTDLIGKTLRLRSPRHCAHPDEYGICSVCFGQLSESILDVNDDHYLGQRDPTLQRLKFDRSTTNIGHICCTWLTEIITQKLLSTKHLVGSAEVDPIALSDQMRTFFRVSPDGNSYLLNPKLANLKPKLVISAAAATNITDIFEVSDIGSLNISRISELEMIQIELTSNGFAEVSDFPVAVSGRLASMTYPLLRHIRNNGWTLDAGGNYVVDMDGWDYNETILALPLRHFSMSEHSSEIASLLESSVKDMQERDKEVSPDAFLVEFADLVNDKLSVPLSVIEVVVYAAMVVSAEHNDYRLPKAGTQAGLGVIKKTMAMRSLAPAMAYEGHYKLFLSALSYTHIDRTSHIFDAILMPREVLQPEFNT